MLDDGIFLYNQSQNPSSGSRGIACIALGIVFSPDYKPSETTPCLLEDVFKTKSFQNVVASKILSTKDTLPPIYVEFRLWKQGRVNIDNLSVKLREAISQATWDLLMEYLILSAPLCKEISNLVQCTAPINITTSKLNFNKEIEFNCTIEVSNKDNIRVVCRRMLETLFSHRKRVRRINPPTSKTTRSITFDDYDCDKEFSFPKMSSSKPITKLTPFETGDDGALSINYSTYLPAWLEFGSLIAAPSVRKQKILFTNPHLPATTMKELLNFLPDNPKAFWGVNSNPLSDENDIFVPHDPKRFVEKCVIICRNFDNWKASTTLRSAMDFSESMSPHALKQSQKFIPIASNNKFIPRQKILWILVQPDSVSIINAFLVKQIKI